MSSLLGTFSIALQSLGATQGALSATTDNIANVNTPGFSRRRAVLTEEIPEVMQGITYGRGVRLDGIESVRDDMLELRLDAEAQQHGAAQAKVDALQPLDALLSDLDNGLPSRLSDFFNSFTALASQPTSVPMRQSVLTAAANLVNGFNQTSQKLTDMRGNLDYEVTQSVADINQSVADIARLNGEVTRIKGMGGDASTYEDERTTAVRNLSELADVAIVQSDDGLTITTSRGTALVVGDKSYSLQASPDADGHQRVLSGGTDITSEFSGGKLGAQLAVRDQDITSAITDLDGVAYALANAVNQANTDGFDLQGNHGSAFFSIDSSATGTAASISLAISDPQAIAASSNGDNGSNGNVASLLAVQGAPLVNGQSAADLLSGISFRVGSATSEAQAQVEASESIQAQLENQRADVSGVSLDEEAANLMRFQRAYQAAARVIDTANQMLELACNLGKE
jgi:flagellar hook-associated protein 1 FlgK